MTDSPLMTMEEFDAHEAECAAWREEAERHLVPAFGPGDAVRLRLPERAGERTGVVTARTYRPSGLLVEAVGGIGPFYEVVVDGVEYVYAECELTKGSTS